MPGCHGGRRPRGHTALNRSGPLCRPTRPRRDRDSGSRRSRAIAAVIAGLRCQMSAHCIWRLGHRTLPRRRPAGLAAPGVTSISIDSAQVCLPPRSVSPVSDSSLRRVTSPRADCLATRCSTRACIDEVGAPWRQRAVGQWIGVEGYGALAVRPRYPRSNRRARIPVCGCWWRRRLHSRDPHDGRLVRRLQHRRRDAVAGWYNPTRWRSAGGAGEPGTSLLCGDRRVRG